MAASRLTKSRSTIPPKSVVVRIIISLLFFATFQVASKLAAKPGDEFLDHELQKHRIEAVDEPVVILEICYGEFNEEDIVRIEDTYGRT